jgi:hypothetical protein
MYNKIFAALQHLYTSRHWNKTIFFRETRSVYMKNIHSKVLHYDPKNFFKNPCATYFKASILCQEMQRCKDFLTNQRFSLCHNSVVCPMSGVF